MNTKEVKEALALIDKAIEEHKVIFQDLRTFETVANDAQALVEMDAAKGAFMPGRLGQKDGLQKLQELRDKIESGLEAHFNREETAVLTAFQKYGDRELVSALHSLLLEHEDLRQRLAHAWNHVAQLISGGLSRHLWEATAHDMLAHISHTRKLVEAHAEMEMELFHKLQRALTEVAKKN